MNKKLYVAPEFEEVKIVTNVILCASGDPDEETGESPKSDEEI